MNVAAILAGGVGSRLGAGVPKQFVEVLGRPVIAYTLEAFESHPEIDRILVVCVDGYEDRVLAMRGEYGISKLAWVCEGGATFQGSVMCGVDFLRGRVAREDVVLFHFAASPFVSAGIISDAIRVCRERGNAISATDYLYLSGRKRLTSSVSDPDNFSEEYLDRDSIAVMNTPHAFLYGYVDDMYREAVEMGVIDTVEPHTTTLMYAMGRRIHFSAGSQANIKITHREDLDLLEGYVLMRRRRLEESSI